MRKLTIFWSTGKPLTVITKGTNPQLQRAFFIGREVGNRTIEATTIEN